MHVGCRSVVWVTVSLASGLISKKIINWSVQCNMYDVFLFNMLFTKFLLTQILETLMVNKLL